MCVCVERGASSVAPTSFPIHTREAPSPQVPLSHTSPLYSYPFWDFGSYQTAPPPPTKPSVLPRLRIACLRPLENPDILNAPLSVWDLEGTHQEGPAAAASGAGVRSSRSRRPPSCPARSARGASRGRLRGEGEREPTRGVAVERTAAERQQGAR